MSQSRQPTVDWKEVAAATTDGICLLEDGRIVYADDQFAALLGFKETADLVDRHWKEVFPSGALGQIEATLLPPAKNEGEGEEQITVRRTTDQPQNLEITANESDEGVVIVVISETETKPTPDVTAEEPVSDYRRLFDSAPVPIGLITEDAGIVYCNRAAVEFLGAETRDEILGRSPERFIGNENPDRIRNRLETVLQEREKTTPLEERLVTLDGDQRRAIVASAPATYKGRPAAQIVLNDITDYTQTQTRLQREQKFVRTVIDALDDILYVINEDGETHLWNRALAETTGYTQDEITKMGPEDFLAEAQHELVPGLMEAIDSIDDRRVELDVLTKGGNRIPHEFKGTTFEDPVTGDVFRCGLARDITERLEHEQAVARQRDELATLNQLNDLLFGLIHELVETRTRDDIERLLCEQLVESDRYRFAWTGEYAVDDRIAPRMRAGEDHGYLATLIDADTGTVPGEGPAGRAMQSGEIQVVNDASPPPEEWRINLHDHELESLIAVPICHGDTVYGVFVVDGTRSDAFSEREQRGFEVLGNTVGLAIDAIERRRLLFADAVTELTVHMDAPDSFLARVSREHDCRLRISDYVSSSDCWILFVDVDDGNADAIAERASAAPEVDHVEVLSTDAGMERLELMVSAESVFDRMVPTGVRLRSLEFDHGDGHMVVDTPADVPVREVVEKLDSTFESVTLLSRQERDRSITNPGRVSETVDALTERQREVLEVAYHAGYFSWPRETTAETVAEMLGIAAPTFHAHIRKAQNQLLSKTFA